MPIAHQERREANIRRAEEKRTGRSDIPLMDAHETQALIRYHCQTIIGVIDDDGIKPSQIGELHRTVKRLAELVNDLEGCPIVE